MANMNNIPDRVALALPNRYPNLTIEELEIIGYFARGEKYSFASNNLKIESSKTSIRLSNSQGKLLGISKQINELQRKVLLSNKSSYAAKIIEILIELGFIAKQKSSQLDFTEHHWYKIPIGYKLNYTNILQLWKVWWNNRRYELHPRNPSIDALIFTKGNWHQIHDLQPQQENFLLQTDTGEPIICAEDWVVWIDRSLESTPELDSVHPFPIDLSDFPKSNIVNQIMSIPTNPSSPLGSPQTDNTDFLEDLPTQEEDLDLEFYLSTFNTEDTEDVDRIEGIYNISDLLSDSTPELELSLASTQSTSNYRLAATVLEPADPISQTDTIGIGVPKTPLLIKPSVNNPAPKTLATITSSLNNPPSTPSPIESSANKVQPILVPLLPSPAPKSPTMIQVSEPLSSTGNLQPSLASSTYDRKQSLKLKAIATLTKYLQEGDRVTQTETIKNTQGQVINHRIIETKRGCPSWAIDLAQSL
jgi:hypothetical protein